MITPGLCSVTLRGLDPPEVVRVAAAAGLAAIEWAGDGHVPPGETALARRVRGATVDAGLRVASYGSYFRPGVDPLTGVGPVVATAVELGAPRIRIWAGALGSAQADDRARAAVLDGSRAIAELAATAGIEIGFEYHAGTLAVGPAAALRLLDEVGHGARTYWQPPLDLDEDGCLRELGELLPRLSCVHVFSCWPGALRRPLTARRSLWTRALALLGAAGRDVDALLEFVADDDPAGVRRDGWLLRELLTPALT